MRRSAVLLLLPLVALGAACGDDDDGVGSGSFCDRAEQVEARFTELEEEFGGSEMPSADAMSEAADAIGDLADGAPGEIKDDLETVAKGIDEIADIFGEVDFSDPDALSDPANAEALQEMGERIQGLDEEMGDATERVEDYLEDECGIQLDDGGEDDVEGTDGS